MSKHGVGIFCWSQKNPSQGLRKILTTSKIRLAGTIERLDDKIPQVLRYSENFPEKKHKEE